MLTHHAYYIEGSIADFDAYVEKLKERLHLDAHTLDLVVRRYEKFGIEEARELTQLSSLKNPGERTIYILAVPSITSEAQQALLKLFEEPQEGLVFVLMVPHGVLLPTLRSRLLPYVETLEGKSGGDAAAFLSWTYKKRSEWIAALLKDEDEAREAVRAFCTDLERVLHQHIQQPDARTGLQDVVHFRQYLADRSPSLKMILEHFAATLPTIRS